MPRKASFLEPNLSFSCNFLHCSGEIPGAGIWRHIDMQFDKKHLRFVVQRHPLAIEMLLYVVHR